MTASLPRQFARTRRFTLGRPHGFTVSPDGQRVAFLRSRGGDQVTGCLWELDVASGEERLIADPGEVPEDLPPDEMIRRERAREQGSGITAYATDRAVTMAVFALSGRLWAADLDSARRQMLPAAGPVVAPYPSPDGSMIAYVADGALRLIGADGSPERALAVPEGPDVTYGLPEHVAAESMGRHRGYWWAPDGSAILAARVDTAGVRRWYISDLANPATPPTEMAYPAVGTPNADVSLWIIGVDGERVAVEWDRAGFEYLTAVHWSAPEPVIAVQCRSQKTIRVLTVDPLTGVTRVRREDTDPCWTQIVPGVPALTASGALVWTADLNDTRRLLIDDAPVTPPRLQVREVLGVDGDTVLFTASDEPTEIGLWAYQPSSGLVAFTDAPGVHSGQRSGGTTVVTAESLLHHGVRVSVHREGQPAVPIASHSQLPVVTPTVEFFRAGERELRTAVLFPSGHVPGSRRLSVLMDPYAGPGGQRVTAARDQYLVSQWFADQGFAVVVSDGRGTPGRGPAWERAVYGDRATLALADQVAALRAAAERYADLDLGRVGIRGWSFGGYLAALAVLREPDVFHAAVAGAPVIDHRLYDTHWNERFLGNPRAEPEAYDRSSLMGDAKNLRRPLMLIHGLADDNVFAANTLRFSAALTAHGRPHTVLPLPGMTHMTVQKTITENLLILQAEFLTRALSHEGDDGRPRGDLHQGMT
jgi:dipeptidyl-peptidase 4